MISSPSSLTHKLLAGFLSPPLLIFLPHGPLSAVLPAPSRQSSFPLRFSLVIRLPLTYKIWVHKMHVIKH